MLVGMQEKIVSQTYQLALDIGLRDDEATRVYLQTLAREGTLRGYMFQSNNTAIAYVVGDVTSGVFHLWATSYLPGYAKLSPGILLLNKAFDALTEEGVELFDFGHGDAEYKRILGNLESQQEDHGIYSAGLTPSAAFLIHDAVENLRKWARDVLVGAGQLDQFRRRWRRFLRRASEK
ncbi:MAG: GNAT family N-acetyltransferase [Yoonia sp.]